MSIQSPVTMTYTPPSGDHANMSTAAYSLHSHCRAGMHNFFEAKGQKLRPTGLRAGVGCPLPTNCYGVWGAF